MGLKVPVGDETREILDREATRKQDHNTDVRSQYASGSQEYMHSPVVLGAPFEKEAAIVSESEKQFVHQPSIDDAGFSSPNVEQLRENTKRPNVDFSPRGAKRYKTTQSSKVSEYALNKEEHDGTLNAHEFSFASPQVYTEPKGGQEYYRVQSSAEGTRNLSNRSYPSPTVSTTTPPYRSALPDSPMVVPDADSDVQVLREAMLVLLKTYESELRNLREKLHQENSRQDDALHIIQQRREEHLVKAMEAKYRNEIKSLRSENDSLASTIADLNEQILKEREEKAELVDACDQYLSTNGF